MPKLIDSQVAVVPSVTATARRSPRSGALPRVALLTDTWCWGGMENHTVQLADALVERGHDVTIIAAGPESFERVRQRPGNRIRVQRICMRDILRRSTVREVLAAARQIDTDILVLVKGDFRMGGVLFHLLARRWCCRRLVVIEHALGRPLGRHTSRRHFGGLVPGLGLWWWKVWLHGRFITRAPDRIVCVSDAIRRDLLTHAAPEARIAVCRSGVDLQRFRPDPQLRARLRAEWGLPESAFVFGAIGRLSPEKQVQIAVEGLATILRTSPTLDVRLAICGEGEERSQLMQLVADLSLGERVVFTGFLTNPAAAYAAIDVLVMPSRVEGYPLGAVESLASGTPVIGMSVGGIPEILSEPELGTLVPEGDAAGFGRAMLRMCALSGEELLTLGRCCRGHAERNFAAGPALERLVDAVVTVRGT